MFDLGLLELTHIYCIFLGVSILQFTYGLTNHANVNQLHGMGMGMGMASGCKTSELACDNGRCVPLNRYCDNVNDCGDSSDEPRYCSPCNRTYYGDVGMTYDLELHRPKEDRLPFICHLTFTAGGGTLGDIVQLTFDSFTLGRFVSFTSEGCPDGFLQITESNRPQVGGSWCGTSWGPAIYYSETRTVTAAVKLFRLSKDQSGYNFDFKMEYKMLKKDAAVVRYGGALPASDVKPLQSNDSFVNPAHLQLLSPPTAAPQYYLGELIPGTYCSRIFSDCDRKICRLQSPNFPGVYPRNLTCYYAVRQHEVPTGKHAMITIRQPKGQLISIRSQSALYAPSSQEQQQNTRELKVWAECDDVQDYVTVYDGYTTRDPVILKFCGGGEAVPEATSSGPELLVEFTSSPFGTFLHPAPIQSLHGFQLEVEVKFVDQQSPTYAKNKKACEFWLRGTDRGVLENPRHSLSPNTTCLYHLQGMDTSATAGPIRQPGRYSDNYGWRRSGLQVQSPRYRVWLSMVKFHVTSSIDPPIPEEEACSSYLNVWDGPLRISPNCNDVFCDKDKRPRTGPLTVGKPPGNATVFARYCKNQVPKSCDHTLLTDINRLPRPCASTESFLSSGDSLTLELRLSETTALRPVHFRALYEFVDLQQDGEPYGYGPCSRRFVSRLQDSTDTSAKSPQKFQSPRDVFLFGRGGADNLNCIYRFEAQKGERVKITLSKVSTGHRPCVTRLEEATGRAQCYGNVSASFRLYETPWMDVSPLPRGCFCSGESEKILPYTFISTSHIVEVKFLASWMNASDDFNTLFFEATYEFVRTPVCTRTQRMAGASGEIRFRSPAKTPEEVNCEHHAWLIEPSPGRYLYLKMRGIFLKQIPTNQSNISAIRQPSVSHCSTKNRIAMHSGSNHVMICPYPAVSHRHQVVEVFSEGWSIENNIIVTNSESVEHFVNEPSSNVVIEFIGREMGSYAVTWLELTRRPPILPVAGFITSEDCPHKCPELDACINASLWCDGIAHCPSGYDESITHCSFILQLPVQYLAGATAALLVLISACCVCVYRKCRRRRRSVLQTRLKSLSSDTAVFDEKEVIC